MLSLTIKNILHKKARSILTIIGIVIAMQLYIVLSGIMNAYENDIQKQLSEMAGKIIVQADTEGGVSLLPLQSILNEDDVTEVMSIDGIDTDKSTMVFYNEVIPAMSPNTPPSVMVAGIERGKENVYYGNIKIDGKETNTNLTDVILGSGAAQWVLKEHNAKLNDTFVLRNKELKIINILPSVNTIVDSSIIMPLETAQNIYSKKNLINSVIFTALKVDEVEKIAKKINDNNSNLIASTTEEMKKATDDMLTGQRMFFAMINNTIIFISIFMAMIIMIMAIHERKKEIGTLKAIGTSFRKILFMVISESTILCMIGGIIALPVSVAFMWFIYGFDEIDLQTLFTYNDPKSWPMIVLLTILIGVASGIFPALSARRVNPLESIRYE